MFLRYFHNHFYIYHISVFFCTKFVCFAVITKVIANSDFTFHSLMNFVAIIFLHNLFYSSFSKATSSSSNNFVYRSLCSHLQIRNFLLVILISLHIVPLIFHSVVLPNETHKVRMFDLCLVKTIISYLCSLIHVFSLVYHGSSRTDRVENILNIKVSVMQKHSIIWFTINHVIADNH